MNEMQKTTPRSSRIPMESERKKGNGIVPKLPIGGIIKGQKATPPMKKC
jgi:hypothetical protein